MFSYGPTSVGRLVNSYQLCGDIGCHLVNLARSMADREWWWERERQRKKEREREREWVCVCERERERNKEKGERKWGWLFGFYIISTTMGYLMPEKESGHQSNLGSWHALRLLLLLLLLLQLLQMRIQENRESKYQMTYESINQQKRILFLYVYV